MNMPERSPISAEQMRHVLDVSRLLVVTADLDLLLRRIAEAATSLLGAERASIFLHDSPHRQLWTKVALGTQEIRVPDSAGIVGHVFHANALLNISDAYADARFNREVDRKTGFVTRNLLTIPLPDITDHPLGVLQVVNKIGGSFLGGDETMIGLLADQAGVAIQRHNLQQAAVRTAALSKEMELAHRVQERLIPEHAPHIPGLAAAGWTRAASTTGGDCFDLWKNADGQLGVFLGDASGHGLAPAMIVSQARTLIRALAEIDANPQWLLSRVNARLACDIEDSRFVTAFAATVSSVGTVRWWSAGHGPIFIRPSLSGPVEMAGAQAPPIGIDLEMAADDPAAVQLETGGQLIILSDGIFEAPRPGDGEQFGLPRVIELFDRCRESSPADLLAAIRAAMIDWQGQEEPIDDQTAVIIQRVAMD
jgi:phosphoserine phosphatase